MDEYFALTHPDDMKSSRAIYDDFVKQHAPRIEFQHRVIASDGSTRHIKGVGERHQSPDGEIVVGYVQDISSFVQTRQELTQAEQLLRLAGEKARLGGWRVELDPESVTWTAETAHIHGMPAGYSPPDVSEVIEFYAPDFRQKIREAFEQSIASGEEFDVVCRLLRSDGQQPWVRAIGVPEVDEQGKVCAVQGAFQDISKLREAQERAEESDRQRLDILESISDAFFTLDEHWNFSFANRQTGVLLERPAGELIGKNLWREFPETLNSKFERQYLLAMKNRETVRFQDFYAPLGKWFDVTVYPTTAGLAIYFRDVTREIKNQEHLRLVEAALSRQNDTVIITEAESVESPNGPGIVYVNDAFEHLTGYSRSEAIGQTPRMLQGPGTDRQELDRIRAAVEQHESVRAELLNYHKSGKAYWLEIDITPLFDDQGQCTHFVAVQRDITERKKQEAALHQAQQRFQLISRATNDVIWDYDLVSGEVWRSDAYAGVLGDSPTEIEPVMESWTNFIHPDDVGRVLDSLRKVIDGGKDLWGSEYRFIRRNGKVAHVIDRGFVIRDQSGKAIRMVGSMLDITDRMAMEQQLRESQKLEAVGHLTGGVAHDFNNLLTVILGNTETLAELLDEPRMRQMAEMTVLAAKRGAELTGRLLAFARRQPLNPKPTDLSQLVDAMRPLLRRTLPEHIDLEIVHQPDPGIVEVDASELDTALLNLVVNARDAMRDGGKLTIETAKVVLDSHYATQHPEVTPGDYVMISVSDTGVGMDSTTAQRAFEPFFTTKAVGKGSGLGLSMVFGFTKQSGGHIKIYSEKGEGTSVKLYFPQVQGMQQPAGQAKTRADLEGGTEHILIAEDDDLVRQHLQAQLRVLGYQVTAAASGPEAMAALDAAGNVDLLLTDIIMPGGMNGRELAERAQAKRPGLKVLFTSGYTENAIVHHGRLDPGVELLSKPYTRMELAEKIRAVLD